MESQAEVNGNKEAWELARLGARPSRPHRSSRGSRKESEHSNSTDRYSHRASPQPRSPASSVIVPRILLEQSENRQIKMTPLMLRKSAFEIDCKRSEVMIPRGDREGVGLNP